MIFVFDFFKSIFFFNENVSVSGVIGGVFWGGGVISGGGVK